MFQKFQCFFSSYLLNLDFMKAFCMPIKMRQLLMVLLNWRINMFELDFLTYRLFIQNLLQNRLKHLPQPFPKLNLQNQSFLTIQKFQAFLYQFYPQIQQHDINQYKSEHYISKPMHKFYPMEQYHHPQKTHHQQRYIQALRLDQLLIVIINLACLNVDILLFWLYIISYHRQLRRDQERHQLQNLLVCIWLRKILHQHQNHLGIKQCLKFCRNRQLLFIIIYECLEYRRQIELNSYQSHDYQEFFQLLQQALDDLKVQDNYQHKNSELIYHLIQSLTIVVMQLFFKLCMFQPISLKKFISKELVLKVQQQVNSFYIFGYFYFTKVNQNQSTEYYQIQITLANFSRIFFLFYQGSELKNISRVKIYSQRLDFIIFLSRSNNQFQKEVQVDRMQNQAKHQHRDEIITTMKNHFEGYPTWYPRQLAANKPIDISNFQGDLQTAVNFYFKQVNKLFFANNVLNTQLKAAIQEKNQLANAIASLQKNQKNSSDQKKKRHRRCASQIQRKYICPVQKCEKSYGTEGSLLQHMKLKHPQVQYIPQGQAKEQVGKSEQNIIIKKAEKQ